MDGDDGGAVWTDRCCLQQVQYGTEANLAARQSLYAHQHPPIDLPAAVLDLATLRGDETVADVGCGNGGYLAELARRGMPAACSEWICRPECSRPRAGTLRRHG